MASVATSVSQESPRQNWIVGKTADVFFIIAAPIFALFWAILTYKTLGGRVLMSIFIVFNVGHHLPTFIRIYGDRDLFQRFRWSLILGPIIPFCAFMALVAHVISKGQPVDSVFFLSIVLTLWDPWHFLMQHYGFMRIYDRHNAAPRQLAGRMDYLVCATWFAYLMIAASGWLPDILYKLKVTHGLSLYLLFDGGVYAVLKTVAFIAAVVMSAVYIGYLKWCSQQGHFVSRAKLWLFVITFGVMYLTYTPNTFIQVILPGWNFALGFATLGMVHVTQYLAIVWKYNRGLASNEDRSRTKSFSRIFGKGGVIIASVYTIICLLYGLSLSEMAGEQIVQIWDQVFGGGADWLFGVLLALCFTSTFLHYYYDGFIWKVRHKENQRNLGLQENAESEPTTEVKSWWDRSNTASVAKVFGKQILYFVPPLLLVIFTWFVVQSDEKTPIASSIDAHIAISSESTEENMKSVAQAEDAIAQLTRQLEIERTMLEIQPMSAHHAYFAELVLMRARISQRLLTLDPNAIVYNPREDMRSAVASLEKLVAYAGPYEHPERAIWTRDNVISIIVALSNELAGPR